jgi:hypothetical protein
MIIPHLSEGVLHISRAPPLQIGEPYVMYTIKFIPQEDMLIQSVSVSALVDGINTPYILGGMISMTGKDIKFLHQETIKELARIAQENAKLAVAHLNLLEEELDGISNMLGLRGRAGTRLQVTARNGEIVEHERTLLGHEESTMCDP